MRRDFSGQWVGRNDGENAGIIVIELDRFEENLAGHFYLFENVKEAAGTYGYIEFPNHVPPAHIRVSVSPFHAGWGRPIGKDEFTKNFSDYRFPTSTEIRMEPDGNAITAKWVSDIGTSGETTLFKGNDRETSSVEKLQITNWLEFKEFVGRLRPESFVFRGQSKPWPLRTAFHRTNRSDLIPFIDRDMPKLNDHLSSKLKHLYDLSDPTMNASFWALAQHHGYPTPLLDWTYSPYVAAYFAFQGVSPDRVDGNVRIFLLTQKWREKGYSPFYITHSYPLVMLTDPISLHNDRSVPQQSLMMVSNMDDIEAFIKWHESIDDDVYLRAIDLPISDRKRALRELRFMGIGAGSLFPGIDGTCQDLKERFFPIE